jgi:hypothetical protein
MIGGGGALQRVCGDRWLLPSRVQNEPLHAIARTTITEAGWHVGVWGIDHATG